MNKFLTVNIAVVIVLVLSFVSFDAEAQRRAGWFRSGAKLLGQSLVIGAGFTLGSAAAADFYKALTTERKKDLKTSCLGDVEFFKANKGVCDLAIKDQ